MQSIFLLHNSKWYSPIWALLFTLSLLLLWFRRREWKEGYESFFWLIVLAIGIVYCPLSANILIPRFLPSFAEYERLSWIFFEIPLISYMLIMLTKDFKNKKTRYLFVTAFLAVLLLVGSPDNRNFFQKPKNQYKTSQDTVDICKKLDTLSPQGPVVLCIQFSYWETYYSGNGLDGNLYYGIRMFNSRYRLHHNCIPAEVYSRESFALPEDLPEDIDYYICPKVDVVYNELNRLGYKYVDESENFAIFRNQNKLKGEKDS